MKLVGTRSNENIKLNKKNKPTLIAFDCNQQFNAYLKP